MLLSTGADVVGGGVGLLVGWLVGRDVDAWVVVVDCEEDEEVGTEVGEEVEVEVVVVGPSLEEEKTEGSAIIPATVKGLLGELGCWTTSLIMLVTNAAAVTGISIVIYTMVPVCTSLFSLLMWTSIVATPNFNK